MKRHHCQDGFACQGCHICGQLTGPLFDCEQCNQIVCDEEASVWRQDQWLDLSQVESGSLGAADRVLCWDCIDAHWREKAGWATTE